MDTQIFITIGKQALDFIDKNFMLTIGSVAGIGITIKIIKEKLIDPRTYYVLYPRLKKIKRYEKFLNKVD